MFAQYETELGEVLGEIATKLAALDAGTSSPLHATAAVGEVEDLLRAASDLSKQLDVEVRSAAPNAKRTRPALHSNQVGRGRFASGAPHFFELNF